MKQSEVQHPEKSQDEPLSKVNDIRHEPLTENERELALRVWAKAGKHAAGWGNLVLDAYDGRLKEIEELNKEVERLKEGNLGTRSSHDAVLRSSRLSARGGIQ